MKEATGGQVITATAGATDTPLHLNNTSSTVGCYIGFQNNKNTLGYFGVNASKKPVFWDSSAHELMQKDDLYYEDYTISNPAWQSVGNIYYKGSVKVWTGDIRFKIVSAQVVYWIGFYPWAIFDHASSGSTQLTLALYSANNAQGSCIVRVWYKK